MLSLFRKIMPREDAFFDMFERQSIIMVKAADSLVRLLGGSDEKSYEDLRRLENEADDITREVLTAVRRSFITPFDRSAITDLISSMDDAVDEMWHTAKTASTYNVTQFEREMQQAAELGRQAAELVAEAMPLMRNIGRNGGRLHEITEKIVHLEGQADGLHDVGLRALFENHGAERPIVFFVGREIYRLVERVLDRLQDVADEIQGIVIDHA